MNSTFEVAAVLVLSAAVVVSGQGIADRHGALDRVLDTYVRDGLVYYRALKAERATLDRYVQSLDIAAPTLAGFPEPERKAFWLNAYNALLLKTVIDAYPIRGTSPDYPRNSIRQIPGAFDKTTHRVAGARLTLDAIEMRMLEEFGDARIVLAIGRGARGGGRLRSEAFVADALPRQLEEAVRECAARVACVAVDPKGTTVTVTPLIGWRTAFFERTFVPAAGDRWARRSPIERAVAAMVWPFLFDREQAALAADMFTLQYGTMDWSLNEL